MGVVAFATLWGFVYATLFLVSAGAKVNDWASWTGAVESWSLGRWTPLVTVGLPSGELAVVLSYLVSLRVGFLFSATLLTVFVVGIMGLARRAPGTNCSCFGALSRHRLGSTLALRDGLSAMIALGLARGVWSSDAALPGPTVLTVGLSAVVLLLLLETREWRALHEFWNRTDRSG